MIFFHCKTHTSAPHETYFDYNYYPSIWANASPCDTFKDDNFVLRVIKTKNYLAVWFILPYTFRQSVQKFLVETRWIIVMIIP